MIEILVFLLILSILVLVHEFGHFLVAKKLGVKVEEFAFGFPPRLFGKKIGETMYAINLLPIGGYVKLFGEDEAGGGKLGSVKEHALQAKGQDLKRAFFSRPIWQRASIVLAGVVMNFFLAIVIISYLFAVPGMPAASDYVIVQAVVPGSPAEQAGLKPQDAVLTLNGKKITEAQQLIDLTKQNLGKPIVLEIQDQNKQIKKITVTPRAKFPANEGPMGVAIAKQMIKRYPWYEAPFVGTVETFKTTGIMVRELANAFTQATVNRTVPKGVGGPVAIAQITGQTVQYGINALLGLTAMLSLNLAVLNVLPIPALDGGRLFFILIEAVTRKKVNPKFEGYAHAVGMALLLTLILFLTYHDIFRLLNNQPLIP